MITVETIMANLSIVMIVVAVLCTVISVITEFTKKRLDSLKKIPTSLQVLVLSPLLCVLWHFSCICLMQKIAFVWYYLVAVILASFLCRNYLH